jgi:hypothetical protein
MNHFYSTSERIILASFIIIIFFIGIYTTIFPSNSSPDFFYHDRNFFLIDINTASSQELCLIPYISRAIAQEIIIYRQEKGSINDLNELLGLKNIGPAKLKQLKNYIKTTSR